MTKAEGASEIKSQELHAQIQYRLMEELSSSERRYRELVERIREVVFKCDANGRISYLNNAWREILGYPVEASLGRRLADYVYDQDRETAISLLNEDVFGDECHSAREIRLRRNDNSVVWLMLTVQKGETDGKVGSLYNIDDRKKAEQALQEVNEQLEDRVAKRTAQLAESNEQLASEVEQRKRIQESLLRAERLAVVGETSGRVAHEVLNPITSILSRVEYNLEQWKDFVRVVESSSEIVGDWHQEYLDGSLVEYLGTISEDGGTYGGEDFALLTKLQVKQKGFQQKRRDDLSFMHKHLQRVIKIINNLRESVITRRHVRRLNAAEVIAEAYDVLADSLAKRGIKAVTQIPEKLPAIMADESEIVQALTNLFRNAMQSIDAKRERKGVIDTDVVVGDSHLQITICDNGTGIPEDEQRSIFNFDFTTKSKDQGTGLGLGISRRFVREAGGDLVLQDSVVGKGSTFMLTLPYVQNEVSQTAANMDIALVEASGGKSFSLSS